MAFAAIIPRIIAAVGGRKVPSQQGRVLIETSNNTSITFFRRFPVITNLILQYLREAIAESGPNKNEGGRSKDHVHPQLFPALVLLSRLSGGSSGAFKRFLPQLRQCVSLRFHMMRFMGAKALTALFHKKDILVRLILSLPKYGEQFSHNRTHGILLQIEALIDISRKSTVTKTLKGRRWLADCRKMQCPVIRECFFTIVRRCVHSMLPGDAPTWVLECAMQAVWENYHGQQQPGDVQVRAAAACLIFSHLRNKAQEAQRALSRKSLNATTKLACKLLSHPDRGVRKASFKSLVNILEEDKYIFNILDSHVLAKIVFQQLLFRSSVTQGNEEEIRLHLQILSLIGQESFINYKSQREIIKIALDIARNPTKDPDAASAALCVASRLLLDDRGIQVDRSAETKVWEEFTDIVHACANPSVPAFVREGSVEALQVSGLLWRSLIGGKEKAEIIPLECCEVSWFTLVQLLQDEECRCRDIAAVTVAEAFSKLESVDSYFPTSPCTPPKALELTFHFIETTFKGSETAANAICRLLCGNIDRRQLDLLDQQTKLFPEERANMYQEPIVVVQFAVHCLAAVAREDKNSLWWEKIAKTLQDTCAIAREWVRERLNLARKNFVSLLGESAPDSKSKSLLIGRHLFFTEVYEIAYTVVKIEELFQQTNTSAKKGNLSMGSRTSSINDSTVEMFCSCGNAFLSESVLNSKFW